MEIFTWDAQYKNKYLTARADLTYGHIGNTKALNERNNRLPGASPYSRLTPVAKNTLSYGAELGFNFGNVFSIAGCPTLIPFGRYEYYNPQEEVIARQGADDREKVSMWTAGLNWKALPNLVFKADYTTRKIGGGKYNSENEFAIGVAYVGWFWSK